MKKFGGEKLRKRGFHSNGIQISFKPTIIIQIRIIRPLKVYDNERRRFITYQAIPYCGVSWKERHQACTQNTDLCAVPLTAQGWNTSEFQGGHAEESLDRLCRRQRWKHHRPLYAFGGLHAVGSHLPFGQTTSFDTACNNAELSKEKAYSSNGSIRLPKEEKANGARRLIEVSDTLPSHLQEYLTKVRCINLEKALPFLKSISYEVRGRRCEAIDFANLSGGYELRDDKTFKGTVAPKDITPIFENKPQSVCLFEGFMGFLSFLSMKEEVNNYCLVMNSVSNVARIVHYLNAHNLTHIQAFLDNDDAGRRAIQELIKVGFNVEDMSRYYKNFKDLNEYHVSCVREQQKKLEKTPKTSNKVKQVKLKIR